MSNWRLFFHKLLNWEYWPLWCVYYPLFPFWVYYAVKARSFFFLTSCNTSITNGGLAMESKMDIYKLIPEDYIPKTVLVKPNITSKVLIDDAKKAGISLPFIVKPDIGMKAFAVAKIKTKEELELYISKIDVPFLIQELITYPKELGVFYVRLPDDPIGKITGIVYKKFLKIKGDGQSTMLQLIYKNKRAALQVNDLRKIYGDKINHVLNIDEEKILIPFGSHTRGSEFIDDSSKINPELNEAIDSICQEIEGFYYGRIDIKFNSYEDLEKKKNFSIIEINGSGAEPTHMYDPKHSIFKAWSIVLKHWNLMYTSAKQNKNKGHNYLSFKKGWEILSEHKALEKKLKQIVI